MDCLVLTPIQHITYRQRFGIFAANDLQNRMPVGDCRVDKHYGGLTVFFVNMLAVKVECIAHMLTVELTLARIVTSNNVEAWQPIPVLHGDQGAAEQKKSRPAGLGGPGGNGKSFAVKLLTQKFR